MKIRLHWHIILAAGMTLPLIASAQQIPQTAPVFHNVYLPPYTNLPEEIATASTTSLAGLAGSCARSTDGRGQAARLERPMGLALGASKMIYAIDGQSIRKITPDGVVTTLAGKAARSGSRDGVGPAARFKSLSNIAVGSGDTLYVTDLGNNTIRRITPAGVVTTLAGKAGHYGSANGKGAAARFSGPAGIAINMQGTVYVTEINNATIRRITPAGEVTTLAGLATSAQSEELATLIFW